MKIRFFFTMSTADRNTNQNNQQLPDASSMRFGVIVSEWNSDVTEALYRGTEATLISAGCTPANIIRKNVPGSFELPIAAKWMLDSETPDAVICLGCVVQGETRHFEFICNAVSTAIMKLGLDYSVPVIFGVLTPENLKQAYDRSGGRYGNKGVDAAVTAIQMVALGKEL
jgi:6,7-dimethyl-8-ribityllumazine synthase